MAEMFSKKQCTGCGACSAKCPNACIIMNEDKLGFLYPNINMSGCLNCGLCETACPNISTKFDVETYSPEIYASIYASQKIRNNSSSGGAFYLFAEYILSQGGVVFGASFDQSFYCVNHVSVEALEDLRCLQQSKYTQSNIGNCYKDVEAILKQNIIVLFTGTPCQIAGLKSYLAKDYDNLFTQDIVCHGVPSPAVWKHYLEYLEKKYKGKAVGVNFRDKSYGWKNYALKIDFDNGKTYLKSHYEDLFMRGFLKDYYLRRSCYNCNHKGMTRCADITLADCWGIENISPVMYDDKGTSLIMISSSKGKYLFDSVRANIKCKKLAYEFIFKYNESMFKAANYITKREIFENEFKNNKIQHILIRYCSIGLKGVIKKKLKKTLELLKVIK